MGLKYDYDDSGYYFNFFLLAVGILGLIVQTLQFQSQRRAERDAAQADQNSAVITSEEVSRQKQTDLKVLMSKRRKAKVGWMFSLTAVFCIFMVYRIFTTELSVDEASQKPFDPYEILGVPVGSDMDTIKKLYKQLSLQYHPDKVPEEKREEAAETFIQISKAYKTLTDETTRKNWEEWGHPDGRQSISFSYGIALPAWMVSPSGEIYVLIVYALMFGLGLPLLVNKWWSHSKSYSREGILNMTMSVMFQEMKEQDVSFKRLIEILCCAVEFKEFVPWRGEQDMEAVMKVFNLVRDKVKDKTGDKLELPAKYNAPYVYKAYVLVYAHLFRLMPEVRKQYPELYADASYIIPKMRHLCQKGVSQIASASFWLWQGVMSMRFRRMLVQASTGGGNGSPYGLPVPNVNGRSTSYWMHMEANELHQLPHFDAEKIKALKNHKKTKNVKTIADLFKIPLPQRLDIFKTVLGIDVSSDEGRRIVNDILTVGRAIPYIELVDASYECVGERDITPGCLVTFSATVKAVNFIGDGQEVDEAQVPSDLGTEWKQFIDHRQVEKVDLKAISEDDSKDEDQKRSEKMVKILSGNLMDNSNAPAYSPYYPVPQTAQFTKEAQQDDYVHEQVRPSYCMWLCNPRNNRIVGPPVPILDLSPISYNQDKLIGADVKSGPGRQTVKFRFYAPQQVGAFSFQCVVEGDCYTGHSLMQEAVMKVVEVNKEEEMVRKRENEKMWKEFEQDEEEYRAMISGGSQSLLGAPSSQLNGGGDGSADSDDTDTSSDEDEDSDSD
ncbi:hypothetical protein MP228_012432 [Amoeboaphelidium protococcarum]|nr:hypothetical protein MP228_012432 [Amoeboaphelidium protococcarum]